VAGAFGLRAAIEVAQQDGRTLLTGWGPNTEREDRFWTGTLMDEWIADGARRAAGHTQRNDAMLAINVAMGYSPTVEYGAWQAPIDAVGTRLSRSGPRSTD
jgi:hypothetical protein